MIHFSKPNVFYCFGGGNSYQMFSDLFIFDIETNSWLLPSVQGEGPCARAGHTATKISDNCFIIIGGGDMHFVYNDIFLFNTTLNEWSKLRTAG
jgi:dynein heavy chain